jgi:hypothetical protein
LAFISKFRRSWAPVSVCQLIAFIIDLDDHLSHAVNFDIHVINVARPPIATVDSFFNSTGFLRFLECNISIRARGTAETDWFLPRELLSASSSCERLSDAMALAVDI